MDVIRLKIEFQNHWNWFYDCGIIRFRVMIKNVIIIESGGGKWEVGEKHMVRAKST